MWRSPLGPHFTGTAYAVQETSDGGFIIAGDSIHVVSEYEHTHYLMMLKLNAEGSRVWTHYDSAYTSAKSLRLTTDGSAVAAGDAIDAEHGLDVLVLKLDADGSEQWRKTFGSPGGWEYASHIDQTSDGGYMIAGQTESWGAGLYDIWLIKLDRNGNGPGPVSVDPSDVSSPDGFRILPNVPNPFEQSTMIRFTLAQSRFVTVTIHDLRGRKLATVLRAQQPAGETAVPWDAGGLPVGVYLYRVQAGSVVRCGRMVLRK